jgi:hypothetical protein
MSFTLPDVSDTARPLRELNARPFVFTIAIARPDTRSKVLLLPVPAEVVPLITVVGYCVLLPAIVMTTPNSRSTARTRFAVESVKKSMPPSMRMASCVVTLPKTAALGPEEKPSRQGNSEKQGASGRQPATVVTVPVSSPGVELTVRLMARIA